MLRKWLESWFDSFSFIGGTILFMSLFFYYWTTEYQNRYAELVIQEFLTEVAADGSIKVEEYERLKRNLDKINSSYMAEVCCIEYKETPIYTLYSGEKLTQYYMDRNKKRMTVFFPDEPEFEELGVENLQLQKETNETVMSEVQNRLPLPEEGTVWKVEACYPNQKAYEGEMLLSVCRIASDEGEFFAEAQPVMATYSGIVFLTVSLGGDKYQVPVQVECYPRIVYCKNGHAVPNTEPVAAVGEEISVKGCPYCRKIPEEIVCSTELLQIEAGTELIETDIGITVKYLSGDIVLVTPESMEWQDDYDENYCGIQVVTVQYRGKTDSVTIITHNNGCKQCGADCNERCYEDYIRFPYCINCMSRVELFSGSVYEEEYRTEEDKFLEELYRFGKRRLHIGDIVQVYLSKKKKYITFLQEVVLRDGEIGG